MLASFILHHWGR